MDTTLLSLLAKKLNLTPSDVEEPYILTSEDEEAAIENAVKASKDWHLWKMRSLNMTDAEIEHKMAQIDFKGSLDREAILKQSNSRKHHQEWQKENRRKEKEEEARKLDELKKNWTAPRMFRYMEWASYQHYKKNLIVNESNKKFITTLCFFLSVDKRFETELGYTFSKGLWIRGPVGIGKTHLIKCLSKNDLNPVLVLSMLEITDEIKFNGSYEVKYGNNKMIYLDDVGTEEPVVNHFGTKITFFKTFMESLYLRGGDFNRILVSTNLSAAETEERYGFRVRSRIKDMFNIVDVDGEDMRG